MVIGIDPEGLLVGEGLALGAAGALGAAIQYTIQKAISGEPICGKDFTRACAYGALTGFVAGAVGTADLPSAAAATVLGGYLFGAGRGGIDTLTK